MKQKLWIGLLIITFAWSAYLPKDYFTWFLEVLPVIIGGFILWWSQKSFPLTQLSYILILIHCIILMIGGHYTYAEVPCFDWLAECCSWQRNHYDKVGHFAQGFIPAILAREIIIRKAVISQVAWRNFFCICFCLAFSAFYELIEWWVAISTGEDAEAFLGTQGYIWDTQSDMAFCLLGAIVALITLSGRHDRELLPWTQASEA